jgi:hypothetical protein
LLAAFWLNRLIVVNPLESLLTVSGVSFYSIYYISTKYRVNTFKLVFQYLIDILKRMETKRKRGRPPESPDRLKNEKFLLGLGLKEKQGFSEAAQIAGISLSAWMRERLRVAAAKELADAGRTVPFLNERLSRK